MSIACNCHKMSNYAIKVAEWLDKRVRDAEMQDTQLRPLKDKINDLTERLKFASEHEVSELLREQEQACQNLVSHIALKCSK